MPAPRWSTSVTCWAAFAVQKPGDSARLVSTDLELKHLGSLNAGDVTAKARCKEAGSRLCYAVAEIFDDGGRLVADSAAPLLVLRSKSA